MKKLTIRTMIRKIVREEVAVAIKEVITELREPVVEQQPQVKQPKKKKVVPVVTRRSTRERKKVKRFGNWVSH